MRPVPPWLDRLQFIIFYAFNPCEASPALYLEMAREPVGKLALMLFEPDLGEIVKNLFTPKGLRSKRHGRKGRKDGRKRGTGFPSVDDMVADKIPGAEDMAGRKYGMGQRFFFSALNAYDRVHWPLALIDQVTDTAFDTFMGVMNDDNANCPNIGRMLRNRGPGLVLSLLGWHDPDVGNLEYIAKYNSSNPAACFVTEGTHSVTFAAAWENPDNEDIEVEMRISFQAGSIEEIDHIGPVTLGPGSTIDLICAGRVHGPGVVTYEYRAVGGSGWCSSVDVFIMQIDGGIL